MSGRSCAHCRGRMRGHLVHLHELGPGDLFRVPGRSEVLEVVHVGEMFVSARGPSRETLVEFETRAGEDVTFQAASSSTRKIAPAAEVESLGGGSRPALT